MLVLDNQNIEPVEHATLETCTNVHKNWSELKRDT